MSHCTYLAAWVMLYGSDVEDNNADTCSLDRSILGVGWSLEILFDQPATLDNILKVL